MNSFFLGKGFSVGIGCARLSSLREVVPIFHRCSSMDSTHRIDVTSISHPITLSNGHTMPIFGLGGFNMDGDTTHNAILYALKAGYRLIDTARYYHLEDMVGKALKESGLPRNEYFVITKLLPDNHGFEEAKLNLKESLDLLGLDYVDLFMIHSPHNGRNMETWKAFVELQAEGLTKSIGVSNFNVNHLKPLIDVCTPSVNQFELHPWNQHRDTVKFCRNHGIAVMGYCPLARGQLFGEGKCAVVGELADKYNRSKAQILLRWAVQSGFVTIPKSENRNRIEENGDIFSWRLSNEDMDLVDDLDEQLSIGGYDKHMYLEWQG